MQLSNKQIIEIWKKVKEDTTVVHKVTTAVREILRNFITYSPTIGFLLYPHDGSDPVFKAKFTDFKVKDCKYFIPLMAKPKTDDMIPPKRNYEEFEIDMKLANAVLSEDDAKKILNRNEEKSEMMNNLLGRSLDGETF